MTQNTASAAQTRKSHTHRLLTFLHQNAGMGKDSVQKLADITEDPELKQTLQDHYQTYSQAYELTSRLLKQHGSEPEQADVMARGMANIMTELKTMTNKSSTHLAELLIQGANMGIIDATKKRHELAQAEKQALDLSDSYCTFLQRSIDTYKTFL